MNRKLILSLLALIFLAQVGVKAQGVAFKKFSEAFPVQEALRIDDKTFFHSSDQEASFVYVPNLAQLKPILKSLPCGESLRFSYGRRVVTERYVVLHFYLSCDVPSPGKLPYNKAVLATFTPAGKLIDYTTFLMHSDEGHTLLLGTLAPYLLEATHYQPSDKGQGQYSVSQEQITIHPTTGRIQRRPLALPERSVTLPSDWPPLSLSR